MANLKFEDKLYSKGLRFNIWLYFLLLSLLILCTVWLLQIVFLNRYYQSMKQREIYALGGEIVRAFPENGQISDSYRAELNEIIAREGAAIAVYTDGEMLYSNSLFGIFQPRYVFDQQLLDDISQQLDAAGADTLVLTDSGGTLIAYLARASRGGGDVYFYLASPLVPVNTATEVLREQMAVVTVISLILAFVLAWFMSNKLSRPITRMSRAAHRLARGDYSVIFEGNGYNEIDELSQTLNFATHELSRTDKLRKDLIANVSHDLRTPLTMIKAYAEMIRDLSGENPVKRTQHTNVIIEEADRLTALVSDMLSLSRFEAGTAAPLTLKNFDLAKLVSGITQRFAALFEKEGYVFECIVPGSALVSADEPRIEQVIYNLVINAINYTGADKRVQIKVEQSGGKTRFSVSDTGGGIPQSELEGIWDRYYRASEALKRNAVGTGIGLSIVRSILKSHNTNFGVNSELGHGSTFWFVLSSAQPDTDSAAASQQLPPPAAPKTKKRKQKSKKQSDNDNG